MIFYLVSACRADNTKADNERRTRFLRIAIVHGGGNALPVQGMYQHQNGDTVVEDSFLVLGGDEETERLVLHLAEIEKQESILRDTDGKGELIFLSDGRVQHLGTRTPGTHPSGWTKTVLGDFHYE